MTTLVEALTEEFQFWLGDSASITPVDQTIDDALIDHEGRITDMTINLARGEEKFY